MRVMEEAGDTGLSPAVHQNVQVDEEHPHVVLLVFQMTQCAVNGGC